MTSNCIFCRITAEQLEPEFMVYETGSLFVRVSLRQKPNNQGHALVIPKQHVKDLHDMPSSLDADMMAAIRLLADASKLAFNADGVNVRQNNGSAAGQDVFHLHFHVVPRFDGDDFDTAAYEVADLGARRTQADKLRHALEHLRR